MAWDLLFRSPVGKKIHLDVKLNPSTSYQVEFTLARAEDFSAEVSTSNGYQFQYLGNVRNLSEPIPINRIIFQSQVENPTFRIDAAYSVEEIVIAEYGIDGDVARRAYQIETANGGPNSAKGILRIVEGLLPPRT